MNKTYLRGPTDIHLHQRIVRHLQQSPAKYTQLWEFYGSHGALFNLLQRMLDAGEIKADNLRNGLITDSSTITLIGLLAEEYGPGLPSRHLPWLHTPFA